MCQITGDKGGGLPPLSDCLTLNDIRVRMISLVFEGALKRSAENSLFPSLTWRLATLATVKVATANRSGVKAGAWKEKTSSSMSRRWTRVSADPT